MLGFLNEKCHPFHENIISKVIILSNNADEKFMCEYILVQ
jgi:hypothetical protein